MKNQHWTLEESILLEAFYELDSSRLESALYCLKGLAPLIDHPPIWLLIGPGFLSTRLDSSKIIDRDVSYCLYCVGSISIFVSFIGFRLLSLKRSSPFAARSSG
ncbi:hypothetical protein A2U01_0008402, partial [Trifolium medium]|nr:hypothetical protein [Trifolium medium]